MGGIYCLLLCVCWLKNVNCANFEESHKIVATKIFLSQHHFYYVVTLIVCHDKEWIILFEVTGKYVATYFFMS